MFFHLFKNRLKIILRDKLLMFWTLLFPIVLSTLFNLAFSNLTSSELYKNIPIAVVDNEEFNNDIYFKQTLESLSNGEHKFLELSKLNEQQSKEKLSKNQIVRIYIKW